MFHLFIQHIINTIGSVDNLIEKYYDILKKYEEFEEKIFAYEMNDDNFYMLDNFINFEKGKKPKQLTETGKQYLTIDVLEGNESLFTDNNNVITANKNNILMVMDGASSGKVYIGFEGVVGSTLSLIHCENIDSYFLYIFLKNNYNNIKDRNIGSAIPHANKDFILSLKIPYTKISNEIYIYLLKYKIDISKKSNI